jgi:hypothetical protein
MDNNIKELNNFFLSLKMDDFPRPIEISSNAKDGGFTLTIFQKSKGNMIVSYIIEGIVYDDGELHIVIRDADNIAQVAKSTFNKNIECKGATQ